MPRSPTEESILALFAETIKTRRISKGWTQEEIADRARISRNYYNSVENGDRNVALLNICRILIALEIKDFGDFMPYKELINLFGGEDV